MNTDYCFAVYGPYGLFTDPLTKIGGEKASYSVPTYEALKGVAASVYWKPTIVHYIDAVRVMHPIRMESKSVRPLNYGGTGDRRGTLSSYMYLKDPYYIVKGHFEFNLQRPDLAKDRDSRKHLAIFKRALEGGGRRDIFLGTRECQAYVEPAEWNAGEGAYDHDGTRYLGVMVHGFSYPDETGRSELDIQLWRPEMVDGVISFCRPEDCTLIRRVQQGKLTVKSFGLSSIKSVHAEH